MKRVSEQVRAFLDRYQEEPTALAGQNNAPRDLVLVLHDEKTRAWVGRHAPLADPWFWRQQINEDLIVLRELATAAGLALKVFSDSELELIKLSLRGLQEDLQAPGSALGSIAHHVRVLPQILAEVLLVTCQFERPDQLHGVDAQALAAKLRALHPADAWALWDLHLEDEETEGQPLD